MRGTALPTLHEYSYRRRVCASFPVRRMRSGGGIPEDTATRPVRSVVVFLMLSSLAAKRTRAVRFLVLSAFLPAAADTMAHKTELPRRDRALKGREERIVVAGKPTDSSCATKARLIIP